VREEILVAWWLQQWWSTLFSSSGLRKKRGRGIYSPFQIRPLGADYPERRGAGYRIRVAWGKIPPNNLPHVLGANHLFFEETGGGGIIRPGYSKYPVNEQTTLSSSNLGWPDYPARIFKISGQ
jgi:hypothetical protein